MEEIFTLFLHVYILYFFIKTQLGLDKINITTR